MSSKRILSSNDTSERAKRQKSKHEDPKSVIKSEGESKNGHEDVGHLVCHPGEIIMDKYKIINKLGEGKFGRVVLVNDIKTDKNLALKIIRNDEKSRRDGILEIMALKDIFQRDRKRTSLCIKMLTSFEYQGHICIGFEALGVSVLQFLDDNDFMPFPMHQVRHIGYQLCHAVNFLHRNGITHTDLKPDNILFVDSSYTTYWRSSVNRDIRLIKRTDIRLIDFGQVVFNEDCHKPTISNRFYRAPEVVLKLRWSQPVDVWSMGCILYELFMGDILFETSDDDSQHLAVMEKRLGTSPQTVAQKTSKRLFTNGKLNFIWPEGHAFKDCLTPLQEWMEFGDIELIEFYDLIMKMLQYESSERINLDDSLLHQFFENLPSYQREVNMLGNKL